MQEKLSFKTENKNTHIQQQKLKWLIMYYTCHMWWAGRLVRVITALEDID